MASSLPALSVECSVV